MPIVANQLLVYPGDNRGRKSARNRSISGVIGNLNKTLSTWEWDSFIQSLGHGRIEHSYNMHHYDTIVWCFNQAGRYVDSSFTLKQAGSIMCRGITWDGIVNGMYWNRSAQPYKTRIEWPVTSADKDLISADARHLTIVVRGKSYYHHFVLIPSSALYRKRLSLNHPRTLKTYTNICTYI